MSTSVRFFVNYKNKNVHKLEKILRKTILGSAKKHVRKKLIRVNDKPGFTEEIKVQIRERNRLKAISRSVPGGRRKWIEKSREVSELQRQEKEKRWKAYVDTLDVNTNPKAVWRTIRNMDGYGGTRRDNEVLIDNGIGLVDDKDKANAFRRTYKAVSRIPRRKEDREIKRSNRRFLNEKPDFRTLHERPLTMLELERAIDEASLDKACGDDDIPYEFINGRPKAKSISCTCTTSHGVKKILRHLSKMNCLKRGEQP